MEESYRIITNQLGKDQHSKVYKIKGNHSGNELIIKIYEDSRFIHYNNETNILTTLNKSYNSNDNNFFIMFKDIHFNHDLFSIPKEIKGNNLEFLFYNFLPKLSLFDYITNVKHQIKEIYAKYLCYKLLKEIENLQTINISHNKLDISNIMFDEEFNLKIIHFSEANIIKDKNEKNKDLFSLGQNIAKILSSKKFSTINYSKKYNKYIIYGSDKEKKLCMEESKFWKTLKALYNINISEKFLNFFHILIDAKKSKKILNIKDLLNNEWLNEIEKDLENIEHKFKNDFKIIYEEIIKNNIENNKINIDIKNILEEAQKEPKEYFEYPKSSFNNFSCDYESANRYKKNNNEENKRINKMENIKNYKMEESSEESKEESVKKEKRNQKKKKFREEEELFDVGEEESIKEDIDNRYLDDSEEEERELGKIERSEEINEGMDLSEIDEKESNKEEKVEGKYKKNILREKEMNIEECKKKEISIEKEEIAEKKKETQYEKESLDIIETNKKYNITKEEFKHKETFYKPEKEDFNFLEINIKNNDNKDINKPLINFITKLKEKIIEEYNRIKIKINIKEDKDFSFIICSEFKITFFEGDEIEFLDDNFEKKVNNSQKIEIKVELIEGDKNLYLINKINQYYLIFSGIEMEKEDFYEHLIRLKKISKNLLLKKSK